MNKYPFFIVMIGASVSIGSPCQSGPATPRIVPSKPFAWNAREDKAVNDAVISAVRRGNKLEVKSGTPYVLFWFDAVPPRTFGGEARVKTLFPGQRFVLRDRHGSIQYKVMGFQKQGLLLRYNSNFNFASFGETRARVSSGSFLVRFKPPAKTPRQTK